MVACKSSLVFHGVQRNKRHHTFLLLLLTLSLSFSLCFNDSVVYFAEREGGERVVDIRSGLKSAPLAPSPQRCRWFFPSSQNPSKNASLALALWPPHGAVGYRHLALAWLMGLLLFLQVFSSLFSGNERSLTTLNWPIQKGD